ncbi:phosphoribosylglycinamide formyltransferase [Legionella sp. km772]|uniref:phosphoribosylglycinamide formyltransferase n=1 Tax=Legionella sp. km772 TaxID=2498111 RepID=UPI000F8C3BAD|nr:phosphoribosylglycinamide formyltransferase [Legionella sp. km772]RUR11345.1 phosphoribosylglycinamide formyltransferase [Legionella sp. km772]
MPQFNLAILGSTRGTAMQAIIDAIKQGELQAHLALVISNKLNAGILDRAQGQQVKTVLIPEQNRFDFETKLSALLVAHEVDLLVLIGYMRILSPLFVKQWANKIINVHPSLLPQGAGLKDLAVHQAILTSGQQISGCTVHYVNAEVDKGPILVQKKCFISNNETAESLKSKIQALEGKALIAAIRAINP